MEVRLQYILAQINDWLKFAEAKNGALVVLATGSAFGVMQVFPDKPDDIPWLAIYLVSGVVFAFLSGLAALGSFLPRTEIPSRLATRDKPRPTDNLLFWGDIQKYGGGDYLTALQNRSGAEPAGPIDGDLATQIVINSRIAAWKYACFKRALWLLLAAVLTPIGALLAFLILHRLANK